MKITRDLATTKNILPPIYDTVKSVPEEWLFHKKYGLNDPKEEWAEEMTVFFSALENLLEKRDKITDLDDGAPLDRELLQSFCEGLKNWMEAIQSYLETFLNTLKAVTPVNPLTQLLKEEDLSQWLLKAKNPVTETSLKRIKAYGESLNAYKDLSFSAIRIGKWDSNTFLGFVPKEEKKPITLLPFLRYHLYKVYEFSDFFSRQLQLNFEHYHGKRIPISSHPFNEMEIRKTMKRLSDKITSIFPEEPGLAPQSFLRITPNQFEIEYPVGITPGRKQYIVKNVRTDDPGTKEVELAVPTEKTVRMIENYVMDNNGMWGTFEQPSLEDKEAYRKMVVTYEKGEGEEKIRVEYEEDNTLLSSTQVRTAYLNPDGEIQEEEAREKLFPLSYGGFDLGF